MKFDWSRVDELVNVQQFAEAARETEKIRLLAREHGDEQQLTRALITETQLRSGLHGYETSVRFLRDQQWPESPRNRLILGLFYGHSLSNYLRAYFWEMQQREKVVSSEELDLKLWTVDQIRDEIHRAYSEVWHHRESWGGESIGDLSEYIDQNSYPARIRGTLRDAVTYLWVELLAERQFWGPRESNEVYRLDLQALLTTANSDTSDSDTPDSDSVARFDLDDPNLHPLVKIHGLLSDLERWHLSRDEPEAALEAQLTLVQQLTSSFHHEDERQEIRRHLQNRLDGLGKKLPWWSMGQNVLANMVRSMQRPDALVEARRLAQAGAEAHPKSVGGQRCLQTVESIEQKSFQIATMAVDGPNRSSLEITHTNLDRLYFRAYGFSLEGRVEGKTDRRLAPSHRQVEALVKGARPLAEWRVDLPETTDFRPHRTFDTPPLEQLGAYVIVASARSDFGLKNNKLLGVLFQISDIALRTGDVSQVSTGAATGKAWWVEARSGRTGEPLDGVELELFRINWRDGHRRVSKVKASDQGFALLQHEQFEPDGATAAKGRRPQHHQYILSARRGEDRVFHPQHLYIYPEGYKPTAQRRALIFTDRSVYRPGQEILWKVVAYEQSADGRAFETLKDTSVSVRLRDANGEEVGVFKAETGDMGSTSGRFVIPSGRLLGNWNLQALGVTTQVKVEEYKRPTFKVELDDPEQPARLNRETTLTGSAAYYFGLPVSEGSVRWRVTREPVWKPYFFYRRAGMGSRIIAAGESPLDPKGKFELRFTPEADERLSKEERGALHYRYRLEAEVTEGGGETRKAEKSLKIGFVAVDARIEADQGFFLADEPMELEVRRSHLDGTPYSGEGSWSLVRLIQPDAVPMPADIEADPNPLVVSPTPGDLRRPRWQAEYNPERELARWSGGEQVTTGELSHGADGMASISLDLRSGVYRLIYKTLDAFGAEAERKKDFLVLGDQTELALPAMLVAQKSSVETDSVARFLVHSGYQGQHLDLRVYRHGKEIERRSWISEGKPRLIEVPITDQDRGGLAVDLAMVRDHQAIQQSEEIDVPWTSRELTLELETFRNVLRPGDQETWRVKLKSAAGHEIAQDTAELLAYMYDKSLELFSEHVPPNPRQLLPGLPLRIQINDNLQLGPTVWHREDGWYQRRSIGGYRGDRLKFHDSYGIGGPGGAVRMRFRSEARAPMAAMAMDAVRGAPAPPPTQSARMAKAAPMAEVNESVALMAGESSETQDSGETAAQPELREDFSETAFWHPHLLLDEDGGVSFELTAPDSVTEWDLWIHAFSRSLRFASLRETVRTVKDLLVRPYLPRFFREGDSAELRMVVSNSGDEPLEGRLDFEIVDPDTREDLSRQFGLSAEQARDLPFSVDPGESTTLRIPVVAPKDPGMVAVRVRGKAADHTDGELRPLPILPSRLYLAQSRFAALDGPGERVLSFEDLAAGDDPSLDHESLVVTLDAQLFYAALSSLPYLIDYPYECTEQTLNRFVSTGILSSLFDSYPAVGEMGAKLAAERDTQLEPWRAEDANRKMLLEESPWLRVSRGGAEGTEDRELLKVLDPNIAEQQRRVSLAELEQAQLPSGAFPWWTGGPPSPYTTLYVLEGLSRALEYKVEVPRSLVTRSWSWMAEWWRENRLSKLKDDLYCCPESATYLAWVLTRYPDDSWTGNVFSKDDMDLMIDHSWKHWKQHSPRLKGYLALVLMSRNRADDARLIWDSVMDSAETDERLGTYWAPEDRAWLWYNDTVESHAFALRVLTEITPDDPRRAGLVQWLLLDKKLGHWKSTRATAEAIYALVKYLEAEGSLGVKEDATVRLGRIKRHFEFEPDAYTGAGNQVVVPGPEVSKEMARIAVEKSTPGTLFASATWHFATDRLPEKGDGDLLNVDRRFFRRSLVGEEWVLEPLEEGARVEVGDQIEVKLSIRALHAAEFVHLRDPRGAGFEPEDLTSGYRWDFGIGHYREIRDSGTHFFFEVLPAGELSLSYRLRAATSGTFRVGPSTLQSMYAPEFVAYSAGHSLKITSENADATQTLE